MRPLEDRNIQLMDTSRELYKKIKGYHILPTFRYPLELHMVHRNIHDETVSEALEHENGLTVLGFKFQEQKHYFKIKF